MEQTKRVTYAIKSIYNLPYNLPYNLKANVCLYSIRLLLIINYD